MTTHIMPMTYEPKIEGVKNGTIRQTIRLLNGGREKKVGDVLIIHGWEGAPYRSRWGWQRREVINYTETFEATKNNIESDGFLTWAWGEAYATDLAIKDGIDPPTGLELKNVLEKYHGRFHDFNPVHFQIIRW